MAKSSSGSEYAYIFLDPNADKIHVVHGRISDYLNPCSSNSNLKNSTNLTHKFYSIMIKNLLVSSLKFITLSTWMCHTINFLDILALNNN